MKKLLMLGVLAALGGAGAAKWEYASFVIWNAGTEKAYFWRSPDPTGVAARTQGTSLDAINAGSGCKVKPQGQAVLNEYDLFNCFGMKGWELVAVDLEALSAMKVKTYWFKRVAP